MKKPCSVEGCGRPSHGHGWCTSHLYRWRKFGDVMADLSVKHRGMPPKDVLTRLMARRRIEDDCWVFTGRLQSEGYGTIFRDGRTQYAHRVAYELFVGPIPDGLHIDHLCRNRACVRGGQAQWQLLLTVNRDRYLEWEAEEERTRDLLNKDLSILRDRVGGPVKPLTLRAFRERIEANPTLFDAEDWGACGCFSGEAS